KERIEKEKEEARKKWDETDRIKFDDEVEEAKESADSWGYWYHWGMMWGFLLLAFACLGSLRTEYPPLRRMIACILLCALLLLVLMKFVGRVGVSASAGGERRGGP